MGAIRKRERVGTRPPPSKIKLKFAVWAVGIFLHKMGRFTHWYHPLRPLRSAAYPSLVPNKNKTVKFGRRLCDTATAVLWNKLPVHLKRAESVVVFKKTIKDSSV